MATSSRSTAALLSTVGWLILLLWLQATPIRLQFDCTLRPLVLDVTTYGTNVGRLLVCELSGVPYTLEVDSDHRAVISASSTRLKRTTSKLGGVPRYNLIRLNDPQVER